MSEPDDADSNGGLRAEGVHFRKAMHAARHSAYLGTQLGPGTRFGRVKRLLLRSLRLLTTEQIHYNQAVIAALQSVDAELRAIHERLDAGAVVDSELHARIDDVNARFADANGMLLDNNHRLMLAENHQAVDRTEVMVQRSRVDEMLHLARQAMESGGESAVVEEMARRDDDRFADFYVALEATFRGSSDEVRRRQEAYVPDVMPLRDRGVPFYDIGPGRGEWLSLLRDSGLPAYGIDTNAAFVEEGRRNGFDMRLGDGFAHLAGVEESSLAGVSAFHVVEHVPFEALVDMLDRALRALVPGGLLLLETPNPLNVMVGSATFWIDPTHRHPLHPGMLKFLVEQRGFSDVEVRFMNPPETAQLELPEGPEAFRLAVEQINRAFYAGTDYAVLARKASPPD